MRTGNHKLANYNWTVADDAQPAHAKSIDHALLATLMDIRQELRAVSERLDCHETLGIARTLKRIARNTAKPKKRKKA